MGRFFSAVMLSVALLWPAREAETQPVFFSMLFPQLVPQGWLEATPGEAVFL